MLGRTRSGRERRLLAASIVLVALTLTPATHAVSGDLAPASDCPGQTDAAAPGMTKIRAMQCLVNWARSQRGLPRLHDSRRLNRSSRLRAEAIRRCQNFSHTPCGQSFTAVFMSVGYAPGALVGENLAWGSGARGSARNVFQSWLGSPAHRRAIFDRAWRRLGVGLVHADQLFGQAQVAVWVTHFGRR